MRAQRGAALLMAMLTVALVASFAAAALWQQWRGIEVEAAERSRVQSGWILTGALDWSRLILREDARTGGEDHLAEPWAVPLEEARLSTFLAAEQGVAGSGDGDARDAFLSGRIADMQSRLNVANLIEAGRISAPDLRAFTQLFAQLGLPPQQLSAFAENLRFASDISADNRSGGMAALMPQQVEQLVWLGLPPESIARIAPFVTLLPQRTPLNLNTAQAEAIQASVPGLNMSDAQRLVAVRQSAPFRSVADADRLLGGIGALTESRFSVASRFFEVRGRLRLDGNIVEERSLVQRDGLEVRTLWRRRGIVLSEHAQAPVR
ncbi:MAG: type II secretion system minor pseudopilin GspK [Burkholderiaceae bacterium]|nr:type II secretion system minor pseudopilin GspK [Burkholderiaceae bacterium]